jgi:ribosome biogenesis GTPase
MDNTTTINKKPGGTVVRVIAEYKGLYKVKDVNGEHLAQVTGGQIFKAITREDLPIVGDWVMVEESGIDKWIIQNILPRKTILKTKDQVIATNIDVAFIVESIDRDYNLNRFERYYVLVKEAKIKPVMILNKVDLISDAELVLKLEQLKSRFPDVDVISTSTINQEGIAQILSYVEKDKTYCFLGSSGVGKSSIINILLGKDKIKTLEISKSTGRGKHTTTNRTMYFLKNGAIVIDNPGMRKVGINNSGSGIDEVFEEVDILAKGCKFSNCTHNQEPDCAVQIAIKNKILDPAKFQNYLKLKKESDYNEMSAFEKRQKQKMFGIYIKKAKKKLHERRGR